MHYILFVCSSSTSYQLYHIINYLRIQPVSQWWCKLSLACLAGVCTYLGCRYALEHNAITSAAIACVAGLTLVIGLSLSTKCRAIVTLCVPTLFTKTGPYLCIHTSIHTPALTCSHLLSPARYGVTLTPNYMTPVQVDSSSRPSLCHSSLRDLSRILPTIPLS